MSCLAFLRQHWLAFEMAACYLLFSLLLPIGRALKPVLGELADALVMASFAWPYPVFLALQSWPAAHALWPLIILTGLVLVVGFAAVLRQRIKLFSEPNPQTHLLAAFLWYVPLFLGQGLLLLAVWLLGYPIGE